MKAHSHYAAAWLFALVCTSSVLSGCALDRRQTAVISFDQQQTRLVVFEPLSGDGKPLRAGLIDSRPALLTSNVHVRHEREVEKACGIPSTALDQEAAGAVLGVLLGALINIGLEQVDTALQKRIQEHSHAYSAQQGVSFYKPDNSAGPGAVETGYRCIRFVRKGKEAKHEALVDFVLGIKIVDQSWIELRPLRLYFSSPVALSSNGRYGIAARLKASTVHRTNVQGQRTTAFDEIIVSEKVHLNGDAPFVKYYLTPAGESSSAADPDRHVVRVPLVPYSVPPQVGDKAPTTTREFTTFEMAFAETGVPSRGLRLLAKVFTQSREDVAKVLAAAANESLGWETGDD